MNDLLDFNQRDENKNSSQRILELKSLIEKYQKSYYNGEAEISDWEFDLLWDELKKLDPENEILKKIGTDSGNFEKIKHVMPMGSQEKAANPEQFFSWAEKHLYEQYLVEFKLDGASLELQYIDGKLHKAVTRGDGDIGDDITSNALKMSGIQKLLSCENNFFSFSGGIRGEVIMTHKVFSNHFSNKANCRNAANGIMKRKDGQGCELLTFIAYDALSTDEFNPFQDEVEKIEWLKSMGFNTVELKICKTAQEVVDYRTSIMEKRASIGYDIDGLVVKDKSIDLIDAKRARPDRQIAFKFNLEKTTSTLRNIEWSINGSTYTPVAIFDEVRLNGTAVKRASLANPDAMRALGVKIGCSVVVVKRGEIIPKIESVIHENPENESDIEFPHKCEVCGTSLKDEGTRLYCPNKKCAKRSLHRLLKWVQSADIRDLGETLVVSLFNAGRVQEIYDFYTLKQEDLTPFFLNEDSLALEKKSLGAEKVIKSISSHRELSLPAFIAGFDIEGLGEVSVEKLVEAGYDTLDSLLSMTQEQVASVYGFADITAKNTVEGFLENAQAMRKLCTDFISIKTASDKKLKGISFCFTGELVSMKRQEAENFVKDAGGICKNSVTKDLSYLVTNTPDSGSSKNLKALKLGVKIIDEASFLSLIKK